MAMNGNDLRAMREQFELSQLELARMTGVGRTYISLDENNRMIPSDEHLDMLSEVFPVDMFVDSSVKELDSRARELREKIRLRLGEAPEGLLFGFDAEARKDIEKEVLLDVLLLVVLQDELHGVDPLVPSENPEGSVGKSLRDWLDVASSPL